MKLPALYLKLLRDLWRLRGQSLAIALIIGAGIAIYVMSMGALGSIEASRDAYYARYRLADLFAPAKRVPLAAAREACPQPGVRACTGRVSGAVVLDLASFDEPVNAIVHSLDAGDEAALNAVHIVRGRLPAAERDEVVVSDDFARVHRLASGDRLVALLNGKRQSLRIVGTALSPEHVFAIPPGNLTSDDRRFAVLWLDRRLMEAAFDQRGAVNELLLQLDAGVAPAQVIAGLDRRLARYGGTGAFARADLLSDKFLRSELEQLGTMARILPPIFLGVAAFLLWTMFGRIVETDREEIGLLKAFGYRDREIGLHYALLVVAICLFGFAIGCALGSWLGHGITALYREFYRFPVLVFRIDAATYVLAVGISLAAAAAGAWGPIRRAVALSPAIAMTPPAPVIYAGRVQRAVIGLRWLDEPSRMIVRHLLRWPVRTALSAVGIAMAIGLCIVSSFNLDAIGRMIEFGFDYAQRQDATVTFAEPRAAEALHDVAHWPGVVRAEPFRAVAVRMRAGTRTRREALIGLAPDAELNRLVSAAWKPVEVPRRGLTLSQSLAEKLAVGPGDRVAIDLLEGRRLSIELEVQRVVQTYQGTLAYVDLALLDGLMRDGPLRTGAYLDLDPAQAQSLYRVVKQRPLVAGISFREAVLRNFREQVEENISIFRFYNLSLAAIIVVGVVYNNARLAFSERARELATMRVLGYRRGEVSYVLIGELLLLTIAAMPLGIVIGFALAWLVVQAFSSDIYTIPFAISTHTVGLALMTTFVTAIATALAVRRRVDRLDLIRVLKSRE